MQSRIKRIYTNEKLNTITNIKDVTGENKKEDHPHWSQINDCSYRILKAGSPRSERKQSHY